jgi:AGCS family alanine or glycine:cation symporter
VCSYGETNIQFITRRRWVLPGYRVLVLSAIAFRLLDDCLAQRRAGLDPVFTRDRMPGLRGVRCWDPVRADRPCDTAHMKHHHV